MLKRFIIEVYGVSLVSVTWKSKDSAKISSTLFALVKLYLPVPEQLYRTKENDEVKILTRLA